MHSETCCLVMKEVLVQSAPVVKGFIKDASALCQLPAALNLKDTTTGATKWQWKIGNLPVVDGQQVATNIVEPGIYGVQLSVTGASGCVAVVKDTVLAGKPDVTIKAANAAGSGTEGCIGMALNFSAVSNVAITDYKWDFGDGSAPSTEKDPQHTYLSTGDFTVTLVASNNIGCTSTYVQHITIGKSKSDFTYTTACLGAPITFTDSSSLKPLSEKWSFGDGATAVGDTVIHTFTKPGNYDVKLVADFGGCKASVQKTISIQAEPEADFDVVGNTYSCSYPATISFSNKSKNAKNYKWIFGTNASSDSANASYTYTKPGKYTVTLIAFNANGCSDTIVKPGFIQIGAPQIKSIKNLPFKGCAPQTLTLTPVIDTGYTISSYAWDFGDGTTSDKAIPVHEYKQAICHAG